jgi:hypothetical protein
MPQISFWNGARWIPVVGVGVVGPGGPPGASVEVYGPQADPPDPAGCRKGDVWLAAAPRVAPDPPPQIERIALDATTPSSLSAPSAVSVVSLQPPAPPASLTREV